MGDDLFFIYFRFFFLIPLLFLMFSILKQGLMRFPKYFFSFVSWEQHNVFALVCVAFQNVLFDKFIVQSRHTV